MFDCELTCHGVYKVPKRRPKDRFRAPNWSEVLVPVAPPSLSSLVWICPHIVEFESPGQGHLEISDSDGVSEAPYGDIDCELALDGAS